MVNYSSFASFAPHALNQRSPARSGKVKGKSFKNIRILIYRLMVHVNETIVIKSSSPKMAEWVKRLKAHKAEQRERLRNVEKCDFEFQF